MLAHCKKLLETPFFFEEHEEYERGWSGRMVGQSFIIDAREVESREAGAFAREKVHAR